MNTKHSLELTVCLLSLTVLAGVSYDLSNRAWADQITGTDGLISLGATYKADTVSALAGDDSVDSKGGKDQINGNRGNDESHGGKSRDIIKGLAWK